MQDTVPRSGKFLFMYKRPGQRVLINSDGDMLVRYWHSVFMASRLLVYQRMMWINHMVIHRLRMHIAGASQLCRGVSAAAGDVKCGASPARQLPARACRHHQGAVHVQAPAGWHGGASCTMQAIVTCRLRRCQSLCLYALLSGASNGHALKHRPIFVPQGVLAVAEACGMQNLLKAAGVEYQARHLNLITTSLH